MATYKSMPLSDAMIAAIRINAERDHFSERYEGFNNCPATWDDPCDCGKDEAEKAWSEIQTNYM